MAPTKRKTARGEHRMDAAFDALLPMGFRKTAIRKKVLELLEVYGKPDGWIFIEEASYKLLIESLLGGEEESEPVPSSLTDVENENSFLGDAGSSSAAGPSNANLISALDMVDSENNDDSNQDSAITSTDGISCCKQENEHTPPPPPPESEFVPPPPPPESEFVPPPPPPPVEDMASEPLKAKRKPCYGWWGEETDIVYLPLMKVRQHRPSQGPA